MSGTLTVRELINELLYFDMDERVYIGFDDSGCCNIKSVDDCTRNFSMSSSERGIHLMPEDALKKASDE